MKKLILAAFALTAAVSVFAQGQIVLNNRMASVTIPQTAHIWGPGAGAASTLSLIGLGSNDNPSGTTAYTANGMKLIGDGGAGVVPSGNGALIMGYKTTFAQLIGIVGQNQPEASLLPLAGVTTFRTGASLGDVAAINSTMVGQPTSVDAAWATIEMVAWDNSSGQYSTWALAQPAWKLGLIAAGTSAAFNVANISGSVNQAPVFTSGGATIPGLSFNLYYIPVPEPSMFALAGLGAAALMIFRRRK